MIRNIKRKRIEEVNNPANKDDDDDDDDVIPASQDTQTQRSIIATQRNLIRRFTSQRSQRRLTQRTQMDESSKGHPYLDRILTKCGLNCINGTYVLSNDLFAFCSKLYSEIKRHEDFPHNLPSLIEELDKYLSDKTQAPKLLKNLIIHCSKVQNKNCSASIIKILLNINEMQRDVVNLLLKQLESLAKSDVCIDADIQLFSLILLQFENFRNISYKTHLVGKVVSILRITHGLLREKSIKMVELLVSRKKHSFVLQKLIEMVTAKEELFKPSFIDSYLKLNLNNRILKKVRIDMFDYLKEGAQKKLIPGIVRFILYSVISDNNDILNALKELRNTLNWSMDSRTTEDVFDVIQVALKRFPIFRKKWVQVITNIAPADDLVFVDLIILVLIKDIERTLNIEKLLDKRIDVDLVDRSHLRTSFEKLGIIWINNVNSSLDLFENLFVTKDLKVSNFGAEGLKLLLDDQNGAYEKEVVLLKIVALACGYTSGKPTPMLNLRSRALGLLSSLKWRFKEAKSAYVYVEKMLDYTSYFSVLQARQTLDILYALIYEPPEDYILMAQHELIVRKQLTDNMNPAERYQGLMALVRMMNYTMWNDEGSMQQSSLESVASLSSIPSETGKQLAKLLDLAFKNISTDVSALSLFYEELALIFSKQNPKSAGKFVDNGLLIWLSDRIQSDLQNKYVVDDCPGVSKGFSLIYADCLNQPEENQNPDELQVMSIAVNLCVYFENPILLTIFAQLNLLKNLVLLRYDHDLDPVNALLGCAIVLPKHFDQPDKLMDENLRSALDIHFLAANWFRELINAFVTSRHQMIRKKVLLRLLRLIEIEAQIKKMLAKINDRYQPPQCFFKAFQTKDRSIGNKRTHKRNTKRGKKLKKIKQPNANKTNIDKTLVSAHPTQINNEALSENYKFSYTTEVFRSLEFGVLQLLKENFTILHPIPEVEKGKGIHLSELRFIFEDISVKLEEFLGLRDNYQEIHTSIEYVNELVKALPYIMSHFSKMLRYVNEALLSVESNFLDDVMFTTEMNYIKSIFTVLWKIFLRLFAWLEFNTDDCLQLMNETCKIIIQSQTNDSEPEIYELCHVKSIMVTFADSTLDMNSGLYLYRLVKSLEKMLKQGNSSCDLAKKFVSREWRTFENVKEEGKDINKILKEFFYGSSMIMEFKEIDRDLRQMKEKLCKHGWKIPKNLFFENYPNINGKNFLLLYNGCGLGLVWALKNALKKDELEDKIITWITCFKLADDFKFICQKLDQLDKWNAFLSIYIKVLKVFSEDGIALIKLILRTHPEEAMRIITMMQRLKRKCNQLCNTATVAQYGPIINQNADFRALDETIINKMMMAVAANDLLDVWQVAQLKPKNIYGEVITLNELRHTNNQEDSNDETEYDKDIQPQDNSIVFD